MDVHEKIKNIKEKMQRNALVATMLISGISGVSAKTPMALSTNDFQNNDTTLTIKPQRTSVENAMLMSVEKADQLQAAKDSIANFYMNQVKTSASNPLGTAAIKMENNEIFGESTYLIVSKYGYVYFNNNGRSTYETSEKIQEMAASLAGKTNEKVSINAKIAAYLVADAFQHTYGTDGLSAQKAQMAKEKYGFATDKEHILKDSGLTINKDGSFKYDYTKTSAYRMRVMQAQMRQRRAAQNQ